MHLIVRPLLFCGFICIFLLSSTEDVRAQFCDGSSPLLPNLVPFPAFDLRVTNEKGARKRGKKGVRRLRFSTLSWNKGDGALELIGGEPTNNGTQPVYQNIFCSSGPSDQREAGEFTYHEGHAHTHVDNYAIYHLAHPPTPANAIASGSKTTFCIIDTNEIDSGLTGNPGSATYTWCSSDTQGMSVGWGDKYSYNLPDQDIDITNLQPGEYKLIIEINPVVGSKRGILEISYDDNTSCVFINYDDSGSGSVSLVGDGNCESIIETGIFLNKARPYKYKGDFMVDLQWTNNTDPPVDVDICRDNNQIAEALSYNANTYTDAPPVRKRDDGTLSYKVCQTGGCSAQCSESIDVNY